MNSESSHGIKASIQCATDFHAYGLPVEGPEADVDITGVILHLPRQRLVCLADGTKDAASLMNDVFEGDGAPLTIRFVDSVCAYFGVRKLSDISETALSDALRTYKDAKSRTARGPATIQYLAKRSLNVKLGDEMARRLWLDCETWLYAHRFAATVLEAESSETGGLDTLPRGDVLDSIASVLAGTTWPLYGESATRSFNDFADKCIASLEARHASLTAGKKAP